MWDLNVLPARGNFSLRKIARTFLAVVVSAFLLTIMNSAVSHAADANWQDDGSVIYNGKTYRPTSPTPTGVNVPQGSTVFVAREENAPTASVLYIEPNTDPTKEMRVKVAEYTVTNTNEYTSPGPPIVSDVSLAAKPVVKDKTQCDVAGVGWIVCVTSRFIASGMDNIFTIIASYLEVKPVSTDTGSGLYKAWSVALGIANLMFIIAFLVIIYAQLTSYGISNYSIKKMIPKLIVAAILVNVSYFVCSIAVDISNVLGYSVQQGLIDIRKSLPDPAPGALDSYSWKNLTEYVLSGGTIIAGAFAAKAAFLGGAAGGSISGLTFLLFPILVSGALAVLIALLVLAARQALITVLIVVAPLAFVAYLLPNTEKWFEKWRELFTTMLLVFPLFSLLFGGSQLASYIIIQNADQISIIIFAMFIQVAPLVMTPFLVKFSGSLLGRLAGMVNDPKKGLVDRARGWATDKAEVQRAKGRIAASAPGDRGGTRFQRQSYRREKDRMNREMWKKAGDAHVDAAWHQDERYQGLHASIGAADLRKKAGESTANRHFENSIMRKDNKNLQDYIGREMVDNEAIKAIQDKRKTAFEEAKSGEMRPDNMFARYSGEARAATREQRVLQDNMTIAQAMQKSEYSKDIQADVALQMRAGGIGGAQGAIKVKAAAIADVVKSGNEAVEAIKTASDIKAGAVGEMVVALKAAIADNDIASMRAHTDMLASSADFGMNSLRDTLKEKEDDIRANTDTLETFRHHINSHSGINSQAEDIAVWSRDSDRGYRKLGDIGASGDTWKNLTASQIAGSKKSTQMLALDAEKAPGVPALTQGMAADIVRSQAWMSIKDEMKPLFLARAGISDRFDIRGGRNNSGSGRDPDAGPTNPGDTGSLDDVSY